VEIGDAESGDLVGELIVWLCMIMMLNLVMLDRTVGAWRFPLLPCKELQCSASLLRCSIMPSLTLI